MKCSIITASTTVTSPSGSLIGRRDAAPDMTSENKTLSDIRYVTSLSISRDGVDVAMVSEHIPAKALLAGRKLSVTGGIDLHGSGNSSGGGVDRGFIEMAW